MIIKYKELVSTSDELRRQADAGQISEPFDAIRAEFQTRGRGQVGNGWESEDGKNLLISVYARPEGVDVARQFILSMGVSIAVADTVRQFLPDGRRAEVKIKWPNDIYWADKKLCGILCENRLAGRTIADTIIGIGLNVNQTIFTSPAPNPVSIKQISGAAEDYDIDGIADALILNLRLRLAQVDNGEDSAIMRDYMEQMYRADGNLHPFADKGGEFQARIVSVAPEGPLTLVTADGERRTYGFKEVEHKVPLDNGGSVTPNL